MLNLQLDVQVKVSFHLSLPKGSWKLPLRETAQKVKNYLDRLPLNPIQQAIDQFYANRIFPNVQTVSSQLAWIDRQDPGPRFIQITTFLMKLPVKAVRNVLAMLYNVMKIAIYTLVHPWEAAKKALKCMLQLARSLTYPEVISQIGAGSVGASLGQMAITGASPHAILGMGIGIGTVLAGLGFGAVRSLKNAPKGHHLENLKQEWIKHLKPMPETVATGFLMGMISRTFQRKVWDKVTSEKQAREYLNREFLKKHKMTSPTELLVDEKGTMHLSYKGRELEQLLNKNPRMSPYYRPVVGRSEPSSVLRVNLRNLQIFIAHPEQKSEWKFHIPGGWLTRKPQGNVALYTFTTYTHDPIPISGIHYPTKLAGQSLNIPARGALLVGSAAKDADDSA